MAKPARVAGFFIRIEIVGGGSMTGRHSKPKNEKRSVLEEYDKCHYK